MSSVTKALAATACFCFVSSAIYLLNDVIDREQDLAHPEKRHRPIAAGLVSTHLALGTAVTLAGLGLSAALILSVPFAAVLAGYAALTLVYSFFLKHQVILDVLTIAIGFVLRVIAGAVVIDVEASEWLLICMGLLALLLAFGKRRHEALLLTDTAADHRQVLNHYTPAFTDAMVILTAGATIASYAVYAATGQPAEDHLAATLPFVLYGVFRYLWLVFHDDQGGSPTEIAWTDRPLITTVVLWAITAGLLLTF